jgi:hypothetical protein
MPGGCLNHGQNCAFDVPLTRTAGRSVRLKYHGCAQVLTTQKSAVSTKPAAQFYPWQILQNCKRNNAVHLHLPESAAFMQDNLLFKISPESCHVIRDGDYTPMRMLPCRRTHVCSREGIRY